MQSTAYHIPTVIEKDGDTEKVYDLYSRLMKDRIIFVGTPIDDQVANAVIAQLLFLETEDSTKDIYMYINTPGGIVTSGLGIYDTMQYIRPDITTVCVGQAVSMGCFLLAGGAKGKRFSLPHSRIMMHHVQGGQEGSMPDLRVRYTEMETVNDILFRLMSENTGQDLELIKEEFDRDKWMSPKVAMEFGIIDGIHERSVRESND